MFFILNSSKSGMIAQQQRLDVISNNLVNVNTHGYKKLDSSFSNLLYKDLNINGVPTSNNSSSVGNGVKSTDVIRNKAQGVLQLTGLNNDIAIDGEGFLRLTDANGEIFYTRSGALNVDVFGRLTDKEGNLVEVSYNEGIDPMNTGLTQINLTIDKNGFVSTREGIQVGKINLYNARGNNSLISKGDNRFIPVNDDVIIFSVSADFHQGYLEMSNVDIGQEMSDMILTQRAYQLATKGVTTADEMWSMLNNLR